MNRRATLALITACSTLLISPALKAQSTTAVIKLGWTTSDGENDPYAIGARQFKQAVERETGGSVDVQLFPNHQLGDERQMLEGMRFGTVDAGIITNAVIAQIEPAFSVIDMPFLFANEEQARQVLDGDVGAALTKRLTAKGIVPLGYMEGGFRNMINNKQPVSVPADVKGVKYRVMQNPVYIDMFNSLGGSAVPMAWSETYTAVQQGTIDGLEIPVSVIETSKFAEITKYLSLTNHTYSMIGLIISKRRLDKLTPAQRAGVIKAARSATALQRDAALTNAQNSIERLKKDGMTINSVTDVGPFRTSVAPVYEKFRKTAAGPLLNQALAIVK